MPRLHNSNEQDVELKSSVTALENFLKSSVWKDMKSWISANVSLLAMQLENPDNDIERLRYIQGRIETMRRMEILPDALLESKVEAEMARESKNG